MSVRIQFDKPNACHTNLDFVTGRVILILQSDTTLQAITVKLEGESKTRLAGLRSSNTERNDKQKVEVEIHKLLYKVLTVFPDPEIQQSSTSSSSYTLLAGQYEYPFRFKLPFNNTCGENKPRDLKFGSVALAYVGDTNNHVKRALPPTLTGFPGEAEIRYYVKATVKRPQIWKTDLRCETPFKFLPLEPPRPPDSPQEVYAKRKQQFSKHFPAPTKTGLFRRATVPDPSSTEDPPLLQVEARLPVNTIITCNEPLPLRLLVTKLNETSTTIYLSTLQIELIARTQVRAHGLERVDTSSSILTSKSNMTVRVGSSVDDPHLAMVVPSWLWESIVVPDTVPPSFNTCNLSRKYELDITIGLTHGDSWAPRPQLMTLPLRMPVKVYSGIKPPPALLKAIATSHQRPHMLVDSGPKSPPMSNPTPVPHTPSSPSTPSYEQHSPRVGTFAPSQQAVGNDDAPPSYEDAMADEIGPVDGPRRDYNIPSQPERRQNSLNDDSKGSSLSRRPSERLFAENSVQSPSRNFSSDSSYFGGNGQVPMSPVLGAEEESTPPSSTGGERTTEEVTVKSNALSRWARTL